MDINKLKMLAEEEKNKATEIQFLKTEAIKNYKEFSKVCDEITKRNNSIIASRKKELILDFDNFFSENDFAVKREGNNHFSATYKDTVKVDLKDLDPENGANLLLQIPHLEKYIQIDIVPEEKYKDTLYWKNNLRELISDNPEEEFNGIAEKEKLEQLNFEIMENISWYNDTLKRIDEIKYVYSVADEEYGSFHELFESI